jgi:hypothetical protein
LAWLNDPHAAEEADLDQREIFQATTPGTPVQASTGPVMKFVFRIWKKKVVCVGAIRHIKRD